MDSNYSLSDIRAATRDNYACNDGMFGGGSWWIILLFLFAMGWLDMKNGKKDPDEA